MKRLVYGRCSAAGGYPKGTEYRRQLLMINLAVGNIHHNVFKLRSFRYENSLLKKVGQRTSESSSLIAIVEDMAFSNCHCV